MSDPIVFDIKPAGVELVQGEERHWCSCGRSANQPFCDGSHKGTSFSPRKIEITEEKSYALCNCKHSSNGAFCDGSHSHLQYILLLAYRQVGTNFFFYSRVEGFFSNKSTSTQIIANYPVMLIYFLAIWGILQVSFYQKPKVVNYRQSVRLQSMHRIYL